MNVQERLLKYVSVWTTSEEDQDVIPSTARQFDLGKILEAELKSLNLSKVTLDDHGYVYGLLPATEGMEDVPAIGFISHLDTTPDYSGKDVKPQIIPNYDGNDVILKGTGAILKTADFPVLKTFKGRTLITTDGTTLLGADDKAGIAEIFTAVEEIIEENIPHGDIWVGITPDEEVGLGASMFNLDYFKAEYAYTVDGNYEGEIAYENFNAASAEFIIKGNNAHPGSAKNIMINAAAIACEIQCMLPESETPEHTEMREGFFHLYDMKGTVASASLSYIIRDHDAALFQKKKELLTSICEYMNCKYGEQVVSLTIKDSYRNMKEIIDEHYHIIEKANQAISSIGLAPVSTPVRGGTDGATLSFKGLPCPNLGTGGYGFHVPYEFITVEAMENAVKIIKALAASVK